MSSDAGVRDGVGFRWDGLDEETLARAWDVPSVEAHGRVGSTNDRAAELADAGAASWTVVVADEQTKGRGRRGSSWVSPAGAGLWMSVVLGDAVGDEGSPPGGLPLLVGLACAEGMEALLPELRIGLKWPNDLLVGWRKVGGILCEAAGLGVVAGIGINVARAPAATDPASDATGREPKGGPAPLPPTALEVEAPRSLARHELAGAILQRLRRRLAGGGGPGQEVLGELRRRDVLAGRAVVSEVEGPGRASGIDESGALVLTRPDGSEVRVVAGSVRLSSTEPDRRPRG